MQNSYRFPKLRNQSRVNKSGSLTAPHADKIVDEMTKPEGHGSYGALLFDKRWRSKRAEILSRDSGACVICKSNLDVQVHHRQYHFIKNQNQFKPPWDYDNQLLITLCKNCHQRGHNKFKVPTLSI